MKTVKSLSELKRLAVQKGATVELGAARFNAGGEKITRLERTPAPVEPDTPAPVREAPAPQVNVDMAPVAAAQERVAQMLSQALASLPQPGAPVREWLFTVERDANGLLTSIRATAQE